jgi:hypothetical protein
MSLILKQEPANTISTPPAGKSTLFVTDLSVMAVKSPDGNVTTFPTVQGANTQVLFNDDGALNGNANLTFNKTTSTMTVANLSVTGTLNAGDISVSSIANGTSNVDIIGVSGNVTTSVGGVANVLVVTGTGANITGTLSVSGNVTAGNVAATTFTGALTGAATSATTAGTVTTAAQSNITSVGTLTSLSVSGNITAGNVAATTFTGALSGAATTAGTVTTAAQPNITSTGTLASLSVTGNINAGNVSATTFTGALSGAATSATTAGTVTTAAQPNITSVGTLTSVSVSGNANVGNIGAAAGIFTTVAGSLTTAAQPNITSVGTLSSLAVTGNVAAGNLTTTGVLSVTGTGVSSIAGNLDMTSNTIINLATPTNSSDAATKQYVDDVAQGLHIHPSCNAATTTTLASISGGTVTYNNGTAGVGATLTTTGTYTTIDGVTLSDGMRILVKNEATQANNGIYVRTSATVLTRADDFNTAVEIAGGDFTFVTAGTQYNSTGWVQIDDVTTVGTDPIVWEQFSGAGTYQAGTGLTLTGTTFSVNASQTQVTAVGTLTSLSVSGNANVGNIGATTFVGSLSGAATTAGTVTTAAQPNITSVGTLTSLAVTGNISAGNVSATTFTGALSGAATSATTAGTVTTAAQPNITSVSTSFTGLTFAANGQITMSGAGSQISGVNLVSATSFSGNGSSITGINASSIASGTLAQARLANSTLTLGNTTLTLGGTTTTVAGLSSVTSTTFVGALTGAATSATTAGTVTTAAQSNITSVGTLTSLSVSGQITNGNITTGASGTAGNLTGNWTLSSGSRLQATYADLAEKYVADATYGPGTVLIFGGEHEVTLATEENSSRVAGVVTTNPAYSMNSACEGEHVVEIALQGRVPVKVLGPVYKGDLLVSGANGHATANNLARAGTIIGKSLENFTETIGTIEVAVGRF